MVDPAAGRALRDSPGAFAYSAGHIATYAAIRRAAVWAMGEPYIWKTLSNAPYEFAKDSLTFGVTVVLLQGVYWVWDRTGAAHASRIQRRPADDPALCVRDGSRFWRVAPADLVAVRAAGNYAELILTDGRRILARMTLANLAETLAPQRFVRVHRSWLVNRAHVQTAEHVHSGGQRLTLTRGLKLPVSRRYRRDLEGFEWLSGDT